MDKTLLRALSLILGFMHVGLVMWDPETYAATSVALTLSLGQCSSGQYARAWFMVSVLSQELGCNGAIQPLRFTHDFALSNSTAPYLNKAVD